MRLHIVDVFAETRYAGNQLAVVRDCAALSSLAMQTIAREMNFSETTFVVEESQTRAKVRIFTPGQELPFAGHPTIGTAWVLGHTRSEFRLELAVGDVDVSFDGANGIAWMSPPPPKLGDRFPIERAARLIGLTTNDLLREPPSQFVSIGPEFVFVGVRDLPALQTSAPRRTVLSRVSGRRAAVPRSVPVHAERRTQPTPTTQRGCSSTPTVFARIRQPVARTADSLRICTHI